MYRYRVDRLPISNVKVYTPISHDAPLGEQDAHFWDWVASGLVIVLIALVAALFLGWLG